MVRPGDLPFAAGLVIRTAQNFMLLASTFPWCQMTGSNSTSEPNAVIHHFIQMTLKLVHTLPCMKSMASEKIGLFMLPVIAGQAVSTVRVSHLHTTPVATHEREMANPHVLTN